MAQTFNPKKTLEYELEVGESLLLNMGFFKDYYLDYGGMPSKDFFSIVTQEIGFPFHDSSVKNLFYPVSQKEMNIYEKRFEILGVDAEKIKLKYLREE